MMHVWPDEQQREKLDADVDRLLTDDVLAALKKRVMDELSPVWDRAIEALREDTTLNYQDVAREMAKTLLKAVLDGDVDEAKNLFGLTGYDGRDHHSFIHGWLFEGDPVKLRRKLVETHADMLRDARVADLEALVANLKKDNDNLRQQVERNRY